MAGKKKLSAEEKLLKLYELQQIDSQADEIENLRGSLPIQVQELEVEIVKAEESVTETNERIEALQKSISAKKLESKEAEGLIKKYKEQQMNVRNNREFDSLSKEIEYQTLEIQLCAKRVKEYKQKIEENTRLQEKLNAAVSDKQGALKHKNEELNNIVKETKSDEEKLKKKREKLAGQIPEKLYTTYSRIRSKVVDGLAVVKVERASCGGCYSKIPPQCEIDIASSREIVYCEQCGRLLVSPAIEGEEEE